MSPAKLSAGFSGNELPHNNAFDLVTINHLTMAPVYSSIPYLNEFSVLKDFSRILEDKVSHVQVDAVCPDPTTSVASVPSDVHPAKSKTFVATSGSESMSDAEKVILIAVDTAAEISNMDDA